MNKAASFKEQSSLQDNEDQMDMEELRRRCKLLKQENQELQCRLQNKEAEIQLQKQSLSNLAVTVVEQDKHIKQLNHHLEDVYKNDSRRRSDSFDTEYSRNQSMGEVQGREYGYDIDTDARGSPFMHTSSKRSSTPYSQGSNGKGSQRVSPLPPTRSPLPSGDGSPTFNSSGHMSPAHRRKKSILVDELLEEDFANMQLNRTQSIGRRTKSRQLSLNMYDNSGAVIEDMQPRRLQRQSSEQIFSQYGGMYTQRGERTRGDHTPPTNTPGSLTSRRQLHRTRTSPIRGYETYRDMRTEYRRSTGSHSRRSKEYDLEFQEDRYKYDGGGEHRRSRRSSVQRARYDLEDLDDDFDVELLKEKIEALENDQLQGSWPLEESSDYYKD
eukprot:TRINITY_DN3178_c0_g1_i11.p1 TRINITY_DN3178_c0_g1~~TRINITY_DN3178_c0_g1_i11.p1  ORF type:complete len:431 (-),score=45.30 TRINITY_DN3178_c0_g1_i11:3004-4152(-)